MRLAKEGGDHITLSPPFLRLSDNSSLNEGGLVYYVYILRSVNHPAETYIGSTQDLRARLAQHNAGQSIHTNKFKPWKIEAYVALPEKEVADRLERYLKTGSGRAFANRHFASQ
jgi:putative endonuclease